MESFFGRTAWNKGKSWPVEIKQMQLENGQTLCKNCHKIKTVGDHTGIYIYN